MREKGFSLIEMLVVMVLLGAIMAIGYPRLQGALVRSDVRSARGAVASTYMRARDAAATTSRRAWMAIDGDRLVVTASPRLVPAAGSDRDTLSVVDLGELYGVTVASTASPLAIDPRGFGGNTSATIRVARSGVTDSVMITGFGRVLQ